MKPRTSDHVELTTAERTALRRVLDRPKYELVPIRGAAEQIDFLPTGSLVAITASPRQGMDATIDLALELGERGHDPVPHLAARLIGSSDELVSILDRLESGGLSRVFVVGGDGPQRGPYPDGVALLAELSRWDRLPDEIGAPDYPEGHHIVDDEVMAQAIRTKAPCLSYLTSQMCFAPEAIDEWLTRLDRSGLDLPVYLGIPGVTDAVRLAASAARIGVGTSLRFLTRMTGLAERLARPYAPDELVTGLAPLLPDRSPKVIGFHIYTFNQVQRTEEWRLRFIEQLAG